jgi:hypothetical protein
MHVVDVERRDDEIEAAFLAREPDSVAAAGDAVSSGLRLRLNPWYSLRMSS